MRLTSLLPIGLNNLVVRVLLIRTFDSHFLPRSFFLRSTGYVARELLGCRLVRELNGDRLTGIIVETEAYIGEKDLACHARVGRTQRTKVLYGPPGFTYVYFTYGMHWLLNLVTEREGFPAAVLIRAIQPLGGIESMQVQRGDKALPQLANGPAKLTQAMGISLKENGLDCCQADSLIYIEKDAKMPNPSIVATPRIGLGKTPEPWFSKPWRYLVKENKFVSK